MRRVVGFVAIAILLFAGLGMADAAYTDAVDVGGIANSTNDTDVNVTAGAFANLSEGNVSTYVYDPASNVTVTQNGTTWAAAGNWTWHQDNGTLQWADPTGLNTSENASVEYSWREPTAEQAWVRTLSLLGLQRGDVILVALAGGAAFGAFGIVRRVAG